MQWMIAAICAAALGVVACGSGAVPESEQVGEMATNEQRWSRAGLESYRFDFQQQCFCVAEQVQPVTIEVRDDRVARVVSRETGQDLSADERLQWHTIGELFALIREAESNDVEPLIVRYDARLGFPSHIEIGSLAADAGVVYTVSNVEALP